MPPEDDTSQNGLPGFRRRVRVEVGEEAALAMLEDDMHCMAVILRHDGDIVRSVEAVTHRMPWDTCPGAAAKLAETFEGLPLDQITAKREKRQNCTHLHDLAVIAAAHAMDEGPLVYDISASDPACGVRALEVWRNGTIMHSWVETEGVITVPPEIAGHTLFSLRDWIATLSGVEQEAARILQWSALVAHGRTMPMEEQSVASDMPPNCYTFQPGRAIDAKRVGERFDFSSGSRVPLAGFGDRLTASLGRRRS